jgi:TPR repeat protein
VVSNVYHKRPPPVSSIMHRLIRPAGPESRGRSGLAFSLVLVLGLCMAPSLAHEVGQLKKVEDALTAKRYAQAEKMLKPLADGGNPRADAEKSLDLFLEGAKRGCPYAKFTVAEKYRTGAGLPKDLKKAKALFEESEKLGCPLAAEKLKLITSN